MMDAIDIQTNVNKAYREAILDVLAGTNEDPDRETFNMLVLGGMEAAELPRWVLEPYIPALAQLVESDQVIQYQDFSDEAVEAGVVRFALRDRATPEQIENSDQIREGQPKHNWNDPSNWRTDLDTAVEEVVNIRRNLIAEFLMKQAIAEAMEEATESGEQH